LNYSIVIPVHNEEKYIEDTIQSILGQTLLPFELVLVDDNSTDLTASIIQRYAKEYSFIKPIHSGSKSEAHEPGSKIINAFYKGFDELNPNWDIVAKLDADIILPKNYFEELIKTFQSDKQIGMVGGIILIQKDGEWIFEDIKNKNFIRGALKTYSKECFEKIGGPRKSIGWDTLDELLAKYYGFKVKVLPELEVRLQKPTGTDYKKQHGYKLGQGFYKMDYRFIISLISALKVGWKRKSLRFFWSVMQGYFSQFSSSAPKIVNKEEGKFIRSYRRKGIYDKIFFRNSYVL